MIVDFAKGKSFRHRTLFIDIGVAVLSLFSRQFFKDNFYENLLELSSDSVPNIRLRSVANQMLDNGSDLSNQMYWKLIDMRTVLRTRQSFSLVNSFELYLHTALYLGENLK